MNAFRERLAVVASFASMFSLGITLSLLGPSLPGLAETVDIPLSQAGVLVTLFSGGSLAATLLMARLIDRPVRHFLLIAGTLLLGIALWLVTIGVTFAQVGLALAVSGLAMSTEGTGPNAIIVDLYGQRAGQALNLLHLFAGLGGFLGPLLVGFAIQQMGSFRLAYQIVGSLQFLVALSWLLSRPPRPGGQDAGVQWPRATALTPILLLVGLMLLYTGTETAFGAWIFTYAEEAVAWDVTRASMTASLFWLAILAGRLLAVRILRHIGNLTLLFGTLSLAAAGVVLVLLAPRMPSLLWLGVTVVGLGFAPVFPTGLAVGSQTTPNHVGLTSSVLVAAGSAGAMVLPWASGAVIPYLGITGIIYSVACSLGLMLLCLRALSRHRPAR